MRALGASLIGSRSWFSGHAPASPRYRHNGWRRKSRPVGLEQASSVEVQQPHVAAIGELIDGGWSAWPRDPLEGETEIRALRDRFDQRVPARCVPFEAVLLRDPQARLRGQRGGVGVSQVFELGGQVKLVGANAEDVIVWDRA